MACNRLVYTKDARFAFWVMLSKSLPAVAIRQKGFKTLKGAVPTQVQSSSLQVSSAASYHTPSMTGSQPNLLGLSLFALHLNSVRLL